MTLTDFLNMAADVIRMLGLQTVITASAVIGAAFLIYRKFFGGGRGD